MKNKKILVTGAGGFIGGAIVEYLFMNGYENICAGIKRWESASRIANLPVKFDLIDISEAGILAEKLKEFEIVIHCAVGNRNVTVNGTKNVLEASLKNGIEKFVHISTVDVYGNASGQVDETKEYGYTGVDYGDTKIDAEKLCLEFSKKGLPITIVRPAIVYGPYSKLWTLRFLTRLHSGNWGEMEKYGEGNCNLIYIYDLANMIKLILESGHKELEIFNAVGNDNITWNEYFSMFNDSLKLPKLVKKTSSKSYITTLLLKPIRISARFGLDHFGKFITSIYSKYPLARKVMKFSEKLLKENPAEVELDIYMKKINYSNQTAKNKLDWYPQINVNKGLDLTTQWLKSFGLIN